MTLNKCLSFSDLILAYFQIQQPAATDDVNVILNIRVFKFSSSSNSYTLAIWSIPSPSSLNISVLMTVNPYVPDAVKTVLLTENATVLTLRVSGILSILSKPTTVFFILKILMAISVFSTCSPNSSTNCIPLTALLGFFFSSVLSHNLCIVSVILHLIPYISFQFRLFVPFCWHTHIPGSYQVSGRL